MTLYDRLTEVKDDAYRAFQTKLVPNISPETIIGVRTPEMRKIAREVFESPERDAFLNDLPHRYYEENLIHFFIISMIRAFDVCVEAAESFLPYVDCWPVSDQATPKAFVKNHQKLLPYIRKWIASEHVYTARFGIRMLMNEFLGADFREEYLTLVADKKGEDYYLKMMVAWYFATALAKRYDETIPFLEERRLDEWVHKKAIQKAVESYRVTDEHKKYLKSLRS
ncbi:MAG: DNA alkylation repair protein [Oscillospiraceae bacterium]|nr:DNA alkylation repair protein [Oscillospiraceae bacterium]